MSVEALAAVLHHSRSKGTAKLVLLGIANHDGDGGAWPTVATLAKYAGCNERNVQKAIQQLVGRGELRVHAQAGGTPDLPDHRRPNRYSVLVACPPWCDRTTQHRDTRSRQDHLWTGGVSQTTPGVASDRGGVSETTPHGVSPATPKPSSQPDPTAVSSSTEVRAREPDTHPCTTCGHGEIRCQLPQGKWPLDERHPYTPKAGHVSAR